ncbi:MAG TPA: GNAT family N-acetyltransferase [Vicinamibacterales bacterium]|jgi:GNAT superfamily N-acetyltransferase
MGEYRIRLATAADAAVIAHHRVRMFEDMGKLSWADAPLLRAATERRVAEDLPSGVYFGWLAESEGKVVAGAGVLLHQYYPFVDNPRGRPTAYILNVYTEPPHRRIGAASQLMLEILGWCRAHDIPRASLHASAFGKSVYDALGFRATNEMRVDVRSET